MTQVLPSRTQEQCVKAVENAVELLRNAETVALPTETVYGLAGNALEPQAIVKIFEAKERPRFDPLIVHLPSRDWLDRVASIDRKSQQLLGKLIERWWPGPLTIVLPRRHIIPDIVTAGLDTVALRISAHPIFTEIIRLLDLPLAAPSANRFGRISPTSAEHVLAELNGRIPLIIDAGATHHGIESTIVALRNNRIELLRRGPITTEELDDFGDVVWVERTQRPESPGQLLSHYAPQTPLLLVDDPLAFTVPATKKCGLLSWRPIAQAKQFAEIRQLSCHQDLTEAAANLFRLLRELDQSGLDLLVAENLPNQGLGAAIMDRLRRASMGSGKSA